MKEGRRHQTLRSPHEAGARRLERSRLGDGARWREFNPRVRLVSVQRSRQSPDESANREGGEQAGLSPAKGSKRQRPATGERRACERGPVEWDRGRRRDFRPAGGWVFGMFNAQSDSILRGKVRGQLGARDSVFGAKPTRQEARRGNRRMLCAVSGLIQKSAL